MKSIIIRINFKDLQEIKRYFKPYYNESAAAYFERLAEYLKYERANLIPFDHYLKYEGKR
jgi:hypothetical protein